MGATRDLLRAGRVPSVAEAAEAARVSRATAYRYFATQGTLVQEAIKAALVPRSHWEERLGPGDDLPGRVERLTGEIWGLLREHEALLRGALHLSLQQWATVQAGHEPTEPPIERGGRLEGLAVALEPFEGTVDADALHRLAIATSVLAGIESRIVLRDIWHLDESEAEEVVRWMARVLARATVETAAGDRAT